MRSTHDNGLTYLFVGVGLGLLAGLLWAPRRGEEMREELRRGADSGLDYLTEEAEKIRSEANRWLGTIKDRWSEFRKSATDREISSRGGDGSTIQAVATALASLMPSFTCSRRYSAY